MINLLDNAFKFTEDGIIELGAELSGEDVLFYVKDTGIGISKEYLNMIFERFYKGADDETKLYRGTGLGLAISKRLAQLLGGRLWADSAVGIGTTFYLSHPLIQVEPAETNRADKVKKDTQDKTYDFKGHKILAVEDEENNYLFLKGVLKKTRIDMDWAKNGLEAVDRCKVTDYEVVLMDIKMPIMNGYEAAKLIYAASPAIKIIAQTAFARAEDEQKIRAAGFVDYLSKPIKPKLLLSMLAKYLKV
jgi:CheY-like chemotaxis protein